jgi:TPR repeat protein
MVQRLSIIKQYIEDTMRRITKVIVLLCLLVGCIATQAIGSDFHMRVSKGVAKGVDSAQKGDYATAFAELKPFAEQGDANAQYNLGVMYYKGKGIPQDYKQAFNLYSKAAEQGNIMAQHNLGLMYFVGKGVPQDDKFAYIWSSLAANRGDSNAIKNRDILAKRLSPQILSEAQEMASSKSAEIEARRSK